MTAFAPDFPQIRAVGIDPAAVRRIYALADHPEPAHQRVHCRRRSFRTSGRGSATNPSRFGIFTFGRLVASITRSASMMPFRFST